MLLLISWYAYSRIVFSTLRCSSLGGLASMPVKNSSHLRMQLADVGVEEIDVFGETHGQASPPTKIQKSGSHSSCP